MIIAAEIIEALQVWARNFCQNPRLEFRADEHGRVFCDVFPPLSGTAPISSTYPVTSTQVMQ